MADVRWRRVFGFRVIMTWPDGSSAAGVTEIPNSRRNPLARVTGLAGTLLLLGGAVAIGVAIVSQQHAPQPSTAAAGVIRSAGRGPSLPRSVPVAVDIPAIGVRTRLLRLGVNGDGTLQVPSLPAQAGLAAWYKYSPTPGQIGTSVIEGHVDSYAGPAVFFRLGALRPGDTVDVTLASGVTAIFRVTGVRAYLKDEFPARMVYGAAHNAALRLITCGGTFDYATHHYLSSTVVFASLIASRRGHQTTA